MRVSAFPPDAHLRTTRVLCSGRWSVRPGMYTSLNSIPHLVINNIYLLDTHFMSLSPSFFIWEMGVLLLTCRWVVRINTIGKTSVRPCRLPSAPFMDEGTVCVSLSSSPGLTEMLDQVIGRTVLSHLLTYPD